MPSQDEVDGEQPVVVDAEAEGETRADADGATTGRTPEKVSWHSSLVSC